MIDKSTELAARVRGRVVFALALLGALACGNVTVGGFGVASVVVSGDVDPPAPSAPASTTLLASGPAASSHDDDEPEGEIQVEFELFLIADGGQELQLGEELEAQVDLRGRAEADVVEETLPADLYTALRIVFIQIQVEVDAGLVIDGQEVTGEIRIDMDDLTVEVARSISLDVGNADVVELVLDLNAPAWLQAVDPATRTVDESVFGDLVGVVVR